MWEMFFLIATQFAINVQLKNNPYVLSLNPISQTI